MLLVVLDPWFGIASITFSTLFCIVVPVIFLRRRYRNISSKFLADDENPVRLSNPLQIPLLDLLVTKIAQLAPITILVSVIVTAVAIFY